MKLIPLYGGHFAKVADEDFERLSAFRWHLNSSGYAVRSDYSTGRLRNVAMHREIMGFPQGLDIDHRDGNRLNNQRNNLRTCTRQENLRNQGAKRGRTSQFKGVYWLAANRKWRAKINLGQGGQHLGLFTDEIAAAKAYDRAAILHFGEFARPNFPL